MSDKSSSLATENMSHQEEILDVIEAETAAYFAKDFETWAATWVHSSRTTKVITFSNGAIHRTIDWENLAPWMKRSMEMLPQVNHSDATLRREYLEIRCDGDLAFVQYDQISDNTGELFDVPGRQYEIRTLLRQEGRWRILYASSHQSRAESQTHNWIGVSGSGEILSLPAGARIALRRSKLLKEQHGFLRATGRSAAKLLAEKLLWGEGVIRHRSSRSIFPGISYFQETHPLVLENLTGDLQEICWIIVEGGQLFISSFDPRQNEDRLENAAVLYGLSETQLRLCRELCLGSNLSQISEKLGVSINTVRTHLQRTFDKTSARSQHDLVRTLLSVEKPL